MSKQDRRLVMSGLLQLVVFVVLMIGGVFFCSFVEAYI